MKQIGQLMLLLFLAAGCTSSPSTDMDESTNTGRRIAKFDWQGHRGARGLLPENTIPAFLKALEFNQITTLELDVVISKDNKVVVSHEPWMSSEICLTPEGVPVEKMEEESLVIYQMDYETIKGYNCGSRGNRRFPDQQPMATYKPLLSEMIQAVEAHCTSNQLKLPGYNIEIKSQPAWDGEKTPEPATFASLVIDVVKAAGIQDRVCIQSFDPRSLEVVNQIDSSLTTAFLVENTQELATNLRKLSFQPDIYSPYYVMVSAELISNAHERGIKVIPWTVNDTEKMQSLIELGVDGIITDYPNRIPVLQ